MAAWLRIALCLFLAASVTSVASAARTSWSAYEDSQGPANPKPTGWEYGFVPNAPFFTTFNSHYISAGRDVWAHNGMGTIPYIFNSAAITFFPDNCATQASHMVLVPGDVPYQDVGILWRAPVAARYRVTSSFTGACGSGTVLVRIQGPSPGPFLLGPDYPLFGGTSIGTTHDLDFNQGAVMFWLANNAGDGRTNDLANMTARIVILASASGITAPATARVLRGASIGLAVSLEKAQPTDTVVSLSSADPSRVTVPATVTILAGEAGTTFNASGVASGGPVAITARLPGGMIGTSSAVTQVTVTSVPTISSINPTSGPAAGGTSVTISGSDFVGPASVNFGGTPATSVVVQSSTTMTATTPARAPGPVNVVVTNPDSQSATLVNGFTYVTLAPTITSINPTNGSTVGGTSVTITGTNFVSGATVKFDTTLASGVTVVSPTSVAATTPAHAPGIVSVTVTNSDGQSAIRNSAFTYSSTAPVVSFTATPSTITAGGSTTLSWETSNATSVTIDPGLGSQPLNGSTPVSPTVTTTYTLTATGPGGTTTASAQVTVNLPMPEVLIFTASPPTIRAGQSTTLVFSTQGAVSVTIDNGVAVSGTAGSVIVTPTQTTAYTLTATGANGSRSTSQVTVTVITSPVVAITDLPDGMLQTPGVGGATDLLSFTNVGGSPATISVTQSGSFFTIAPTSFTIEPGATQVVNITANGQPAGSYEGFITAAGSGIQGSVSIPVRLLVSAPPQGTVEPNPKSNRGDVTQPTGTLEFTNSGSGILQGILVSDVPWLIPQMGVVTIAPGQTVTVTFSIDRSKRPDAPSPVGAVTGNIALVYLDRPSSGATVAMIQALDDNAEKKRRVSQVIDLAALAPSTGPIPPLASGEVAFFLPGLANKANLVSDLILANTTPTSLTGMRLFFARSGAPTTSVPQALASIVPSGKVLLSDLVNGVFKRPEGEVGGVQVRAGNPARLNLAAVVTNPINAAGLFGGSVASQRSDRGIGFNEKTVLAGVRKDGGARTDLYVQEVAGQQGAVRTEFFGEDGTVRKTLTNAIGAFAILELTNEAPAGAVSASITNLGTSSRIIAQGLVLDEQSGDPTNLVDWNRRNGTAATESQIVPLAASGVAGGKKTRTDVWITNSGSTTATGTLSFYGDPSRKRAARRSTGAGSSGFGSTRIESMEASRAITVEAGRTRVLRDVLASEFARSTASGYLLYTPTPLSGTVAITSGTFKDSITAEPGASGGSGTSVPVMATSLGMKVGAIRQFSSLEDASPSSVATAAKVTYRTGFGLIETSGKTVTVKATLIYRPPVQDSDQATGVPISASKQYTLTPRGAIFVDQIGPMLGPNRPLNDLHDLVLAIVVLSGEGGVIPYTLATENGSGDTILRIE